LLNFYSNARISLGEESAPELKLYATELSRECAQTLINYNKNPLYENFAKACAAMTERGNIRYLASALSNASKNRQDVKDIMPVAMAASGDTLKCQELMASYAFNAFGPTVKAYCEGPEVKDGYELLQYMLPTFGNNRWTLSADQAKTFKKFKTAGAKDCFKQAINQGQNPLRTEKATECLEK
jgi:hypothetical protein